MSRSLSSLLLPLACLVPVASSFGQTTIAARVTTLTPYGNFATESGRSVLKTLPARTSIPSPGQTVSVNMSNTSAATIIGWRVRGNVASIDVSEQGTASSSSGVVSAGTTRTLSGAPVQDAHDLLFEITGRAGTRGLLEMWVSGLARTYATSRYGVDIGNNGRVDFQAAATPAGAFVRSERPVLIPSSGVLAIRIVSSGAIALRAGSSVYKSGVSVRFTPGIACDVTTYGTSCGPRFSGAWQTIGQQRNLELNVFGPALSPGILVIGSQRLALRIPGSACWIHTDFLSSGAFVTDAQGAATHKFTIPSDLSFKLSCQDFLFTNNLTSIVSTQGLALECR